MFDQSVEDPFAFGGRGTGRVAEDTVCRHRSHATGAELREEVAHRSSVAWLCSIEANEVGREMQHQ